MKIYIPHVDGIWTCPLCRRKVRQNRVILKIDDTRGLHLKCLEKLIANSPPDIDDETLIMDQFNALAERVRNGENILAGS